MVQCDGWRHCAWHGLLMCECRTTHHTSHVIPQREVEALRAKVAALSASASARGEGGEGGAAPMDLDPASLQGHKAEDHIYKVRAGR